MIINLCYEMKKKNYRYMIKEKLFKSENISYTTRSYPKKAYFKK